MKPSSAQSIPVLIVPGGSVKNREWAEATVKDLAAYGQVSYIAFDHWKTGEKALDWIDIEAAKISQKLASGSVSIVAKSIGTAIALAAIDPESETVDKLILCGIPLADLLPGDEIMYASLAEFPTEKLLCLQNMNDPHGTYAQVKSFLEQLNPKIRLIAKPRSDHEYPYSSDFISFLGAKV
jgi:predicted alpha/beta hydrolase family esterase